MDPLEIIPQIADPSPCLLCVNAKEPKSKRRYRVPVGYNQFDALRQAPHPEAARAAVAALPSIPSAQQLHAFVDEGYGLGLWVSKHLLSIEDPGDLDDADLQRQAGAVIIFPPSEWALFRAEFADWQFDGVEAAFEGLPYTFDDILIFAGLNFSPDCWFLILRGPMAGNICWWTHDGDSVMDKPWATDFRDWARRIFTDPLEDTLGGMTSFTAADSIDQAPEDADLYPVEYRPEIPASAD